MRYLTANVSVSEGRGLTSIVISPRLTRGREALLATWTLAWTLCGIWFMVELARTPDSQLRQGLLVLLAFWAYFELRVGRALLWRLKGFELVRVKHEPGTGAVLTLKDSILGFGRARNHFVANIERFGLLPVDESSWKWQFNDSFWVVGGERMGFEDNGRKVVFGKGLTRREAEQVAVLIEKALNAGRKEEEVVSSTQGY